MPSFLVPRHISTHRIAAIALYRALLQQSSKAPLKSTHRDELQNIIRNRFRQHQNVHSYQRLRLAFQAGYEAIDHLDASVAGQDESTVYLVSLLERASAKVKAAPIRKPTSKKDTSGKVHQTGRMDSKPSDAIFARPKPLEELSGPRHVPVLYSANTIPVLRLSKPQPQSLSQYIDKRIKTRQKRLNRMQTYEREARFARMEDAWDEEISQQYGVEDSVGSDERKATYEPSWAEELDVAHVEVSDALDRDNEKRKAMAERMQGVVDREQELFDQERQERKERLRLEKIDRRRVRRESDIEHSVEDTGSRVEGTDL